jgi:hypothetical protein
VVITKANLNAVLSNFSLAHSLKVLVLKGIKLEAAIHKGLFPIQKSIHRNLGHENFRKLIRILLKSLDLSLLDEKYLCECVNNDVVSGKKKLEMYHFGKLTSQY